MRLARFATPIAVLTLVLAGCGGGSQVTVQEVPGGAADLTVKGGEALAPKATATATATASATATATTTGTAPATTQQQPAGAAPQATPQPQSTPQGTAGGGAAAPQATPPPGADKQQFETFCQQNPGAC